jgi:ribonucleoside-triphosphate reductase
VADKCGETCEVYSRVTGYFRPVANFNRAKKEEFKDRAMFKITDGMRIPGILEKHSN